MQQIVIIIKKDMKILLDTNILDYIENFKKKYNIIINKKI